MSKAIRRSKKLNSDNENFFVYEDGECPKIGAVPYDGVYDFSKNSASHLIDTLYLNDGNFFSRHDNDISDFISTYKI